MVIEARLFLVRIVVSAVRCLADPIRDRALDKPRDRGGAVELVSAPAGAPRAPLIRCELAISDPRAHRFRRDVEELGELGRR